jgi:hypothetical protein
MTPASKTSSLSVVAAAYIVAIAVAAAWLTWAPAPGGFGSTP